ncbi:MAG TPA: bifunctional hydroxymethylpyrimidine kinase/phosphomethylpyrimidine kinase [Rhodospirillaceae bacterium]|nr:bifunctional hydroxymethylpyrimidine kinase/phosphomethylpyrimidine kinase [Rhodospirillaceae bacterium]
MQSKGRVLIIAGSDSGGGAGIQADIKTVTALGGYAMTAIAALTAQNTHGVTGIHAVPADFVAEQMRRVLEDIGADCIKIGMLHRAEVIHTVADVLADMAADVPMVLDTVMIAKGGHALLEGDAVQAIKERLVPGATLVTPNLPEAEVLTGLPVRTVDDMIDAGQDILALGAEGVLMKGGHLDGDVLTDLLLRGDDAGEEAIVGWESTRIDTPHTHGTGCTLASACAAGIAQGMDLVDAVARARAYVIEGIRTAPGFGGGHGPLNHGFTVAPFQAD